MVVQIHPKAKNSFFLNVSSLFITSIGAQV